MTGLKDRTAVVLGATGAVGGRLARRLLDEGARLAVPVRRDWQVERVAKDLDAPPERLLVGVVPGGDGEAAAGFAKGVADSLGPVDAVFSAAGAFAMAAAGRERQDRVDELLAANYLAPATLARAFVGDLRRRGTGALVFTGAAAVGGRATGMAAYRASKAALHEYALALHHELRADGVTVAVVTPGIIDTPANREAMPDADRGSWQTIDEVVDALLGAATSGVPVGDPFVPVRTGARD